MNVNLNLGPELLARFEALMEALRRQGRKGSREELVLEALAEVGCYLDCEH